VSPAAFALCLGFGVLVGTFSGLLGLGGGVLLVPFLYWLLPQVFDGSADPEVLTVMAHATSLSVIVLASSSGVWAYHRKDAVARPTLLAMGLGAVVGATLGARAATEVPAGALKAGFGVLLVAAGLRLVADRRRRTAAAPPRGGWGLAAAGGAGTGFLAALMGVGGGILAIPFLIYAVRLDLKKVAGTSLGMIAFGATAGTLTYVLSGLGAQGRPAGALGYVFLPATLALAPGAVAAARLGAWLNQRMDVRLLRRVFALVLVVLGLRLAWLNGTALAALF